MHASIAVFSSVKWLCLPLPNYHMHGWCWSKLMEKRNLSHGTYSKCLHLFPVGRIWSSLIIRIYYLFCLFRHDLWLVFGVMNWPLFLLQSWDFIRKDVPSDAFFKVDAKWISAAQQWDIRDLYLFLMIIILT